MTCTRRTLLMGAAAGAVVTTTSAVAMAATKRPLADASLFSTIGRWRELSATADACSERCDQLEDKARELLGNIDPFALEQEARQAGIEARLVSALSKARPRHSGDVQALDRCADLCDAATGATERAQAAAAAAKTAQAERLRIRQSLNLDEMERQWEQACSAAGAAYGEVCKHLATTPEGLKAKMAVILEVNEGSDVDLADLVTMIDADMDAISATIATRN